MNKKNDLYRALGASGGVTGVVYASILLMESSSIYIIPFPFPIPDRIYAIAYIYISYFLIGNRKDNIGHEAHLGGAFTGTLIALARIPWVFKEEYLLIVGMMIPIIAIPFINKYIRR